MNPLLQPHPALNGCHPDRREACPPRRGSAFSSLTARRSLHFPLHFPLHFLSFMAPFPILVPFVFNSLRTLLQLGGRGGIGRARIASNQKPNSPAFSPCRSLNFVYVLSFHILTNSLRFRKTQLLYFHTIPNSFAKTPGVGEGASHWLNERAAACGGFTQGGVCEGHSMRRIDFAPQLSANGWSQILPDGLNRQ